MKRATQTALYALGGYAGFCAVNYYFSSARTGVASAPGTFAAFNDKLLPFNLLAHMLKPAGASLPGMQVTPFAPPPPAQITQSDTGTTTYWGP
jgi:hypothetical protein